VQQSLEAYFLINFFVDTALIAIVARADGCLRIRRVLTGGLISAVYSAVVVTVSPRLAHPAVQCAMVILLGLIVSGNPEIHRWGTLSFHLICATLMLGGFGTLFLSRKVTGINTLIGAGLLLLHLFFRQHLERSAVWEVTVCLKFHGETAVFRALIDTGNRLHEPISGLPVLIAEQTLLKKMFTGDSARRTRYRCVAFGGLGGDGTIPCFRPDEIYIRRGEKLIPAPDVWVALYPGRIPGSNRALAPPSFAMIPGKA